MLSRLTSFGHGALAGAYRTGRFGAPPGDSVSGRTAFSLCSCGPSCEVAERLVPSRGDGAGMTPEETGAFSVAFLAFCGDGSCAQDGAGVKEAALMAANATIIIRRCILDAPFSMLPVGRRPRGREIHCDRILHNFADANRLRPDCGRGSTCDNLIPLLRALPACAWCSRWRLRRCSTTRSACSITKRYSTPLRAILVTSTIWTGVR